MKRRDFLKQTTALTVYTGLPAWPVPAAPMPSIKCTYMGVPVVFAKALPDGFIVVTNEAFMEEMRRQWALCKRTSRT